MREDYNGDLYDVYYKDGNGERQCVCVILATPKEIQKDCLILKIEM